MRQVLLSLSICFLFVACINAFTRRNHRKAQDHCDKEREQYVVYPEQYFPAEMDHVEYERLVEMVRGNNEEWRRLQLLEQYYYPEDYDEQYSNYGNKFGCKDVCKSRKKIVGGVYLSFSEYNHELNVTLPCFVVGNQRLFYTECPGKNPDFHSRKILTSAFQCMQDDVVYREALVVCPTVSPQCHFKLFVLPQSCTLNQVTCKRMPIILPRQKSSLFSRMFMERFHG